MPGLRGQAEIGELQGLHHLYLLAEKGKVARGLEVGIQESQTEGQNASQNEGDKNRSFSQTRSPSGRTCPEKAKISQSRFKMAEGVQVKEGIAV